MQFNIGTLEPRGIVGSRSARSTTLKDAMRECREYSKSRNVKEAWLREWKDGTLGPIIVTFRKGK